MEIIKQSHIVVGLVPTDPIGNMERIELVGRCCYQSYDKQTDTSYLPFTMQMIDKKHFAMVEHSNMVIKVTIGSDRYIDQLESLVNSNFIFSKVEIDNNRDTVIYFGGNYRAWMELIQYDGTPFDLFNAIRKWFLDFSNFEPYEVKDQNEIPNNLKRITVFFRTNRAVTHELVRHRPPSYGQLCLSGDSIVQSFSSKKWTIKELYEYSLDEKRKGRLQLINLRGIDKLGRLIPVKIKEVINTGINEVYKVTTKTGRSIKATMNHRFLTENGWKKLKHIKVGNKLCANSRKIEVSKDFIQQKYINENMQRKDVAILLGISDACLGKKISEFGLQKEKKDYPNRKGGGWYGDRSEDFRNKLSEQKIGNKNPNYKGMECKNGNSQATAMFDISNKYCVCGKKAEERHHIDKNPNNNIDDNIEFVCSKCHKARHKIGSKVIFHDEIISIDYIGMEETFDIEIDHPCHCFVANGLVVHNSQRYVRHKNMQFIQPVGLEMDSQFMEIFIANCKQVERDYNLLLANYKPQQARNVLTNAVATDIYVTADIPEWRHIFKLRCARDADPQMQDAMIPVQCDFEKNGWLL